MFLLNSPKTEIFYKFRQTLLFNAAVRKYFWCKTFERSAAWKVSVVGVILVRIFPHLDLIGRDTPYLSVFSPIAGKYGTEKLQMRKLFTQWRYFGWRKGALFYCKKTSWRRSKERYLRNAPLCTSSGILGSKTPTFIGLNTD